MFGITLFGGCCKWLQSRYSLQINNNSGNNICCYFYLVWEGGNEGVVYPDTIISFDKKDLICINSGEKIRTSRALVPIIEWISTLPGDTLSVYFLSSDTLSKYSWEDVQQKYKILQRYDLSAEDIQILYGKNDVPEIPYPPTEAMKEMKMYPPYGQ
jgi:hypothetical protein